jgi:hypothetical protein
MVRWPTNFDRQLPNRAKLSLQAKTGVNPALQIFDGLLIYPPTPEAGFGLLPVRFREINGDRFMERLMWVRTVR